MGGNTIGTTMTNFGRPSLKNCGLPLLSVDCCTSALVTVRATTPMYCVPIGLFMNFHDGPELLRCSKKSSSVPLTGGGTGAAGGA